MLRTCPGGKCLSVVPLTVALLLVAVTAAAADLEFPVTLDPLDPELRALVEPQFGSFFYPGPDPDGSIVWVMGTELASVPSDTYELRYVIFDIGEFKEFSLEFKTRGWAVGSGNPSQFIIFGWQDHKNFYYSYPAQSTATRVARVVDGKHETLYNHGKEIWWRDRERYQTVRVDVKEVDGRIVVDTYVNGELRMTYTFAEGQEPPAGKVGIAMWNNSAHNAYIKDITVKPL